MLDLLLLAAVQVQTIKLPPAQPAPPTGVAEIKLAPDLVVKEIRIEGREKFHVLIANIGTGPVGQPFAVRGSFEYHGTNYDLKPIYTEPMAAGEQRWVWLYPGWTPLNEAASASAGVDLLPEPKTGGSWVIWPNPFAGVDDWFRRMYPDAKRCEVVSGCVVEINEDNNNYTVAGVPRGTPDRLNAPEASPTAVLVPERG